MYDNLHLPQSGRRTRRTAALAPYRRDLHASPVALIEDFSISASQPAASGFSDRRQIALAYSGGFAWRTAGAANDVIAGDVLMVQAEEEFVERHLDRRVGHASLLITPSEELLDAFSRPGRPISVAFDAEPGRAGSSVALARHALLNRLGGAERADRLFAEETVVALVENLVGAPMAALDVNEACLGTARDLLRDPATLDWSLSDIASEAGCGAATLAIGFRRAHGQSLDGYRRATRRGETPSRRPARVDLDRVLRAARHVEAFYGEPCQLDELAGIAGLSRYHFIRVFSAAMSLTPAQYVIAVRLRAAATALLMANDSITEVALSAGFNDISHFNFSFRHAFGMSPSAWRACRGDAGVRRAA